MKRFELDAEQTDAILELKLYRLARLEILVIQNELADKRKRARQITRSARRTRTAAGRSFESEIEEIQRQPTARTDKRRTLIEAEEDVAFTEDDFIVEEDNDVLVSRDGWVKRQKEVRDLSTTRLREGDSVLAVLPAARARRVVFFSELRHRLHRAHHRRARRRPDTASRSRSCSSCATASAIIAAISLDPRVAGDITPKKEGAAPKVHAIAVTSDGYSLRFGLDGFVEPSTRAGRRYARPSTASRSLVWPRSEATRSSSPPPRRRARFCAAPTR